MIPQANAKYPNGFFNLTEITNQEKQLKKLLKCLVRNKVKVNHLNSIETILFFFLLFKEKSYWSLQLQF